MAKLGSEIVRIGKAMGLTLEEIFHLDPDVIARAGTGDHNALRVYDENRLATIAKPGGGEHRPSMGQDIFKGRRTEIEMMNGLVVAEGKKLGIDAPANAALTEIAKKVERREIKPDRAHIARLNMV